MLAEGYSTRRGRRSAYLHYDTVNRRLRPRKGARLTAVTNAGVIPDQFDYDVVLNPEGFRIGSVGEDFAFESMPGDIFQLGNTSYRVQKVEVNKIFVEDARGMAPTLPFWVGEAPARSDELSAAVSRLRADALGQLADGGPEALEAWLRDEKQLDAVAASQLAQYLAAGQAALGTLPTLDTIVFERFFDDVGDTHLVIHSTFGSRINRAWGLALRKRFCRQFNFELQASALEDSIVLSLGPTHSFPLEDVKSFLKSATAEDVLVQALLDAPVFGTRWRWDAAIALALVRNRNGKRMPAPFQRADSEDLLAVVFPDQLACAENLTGPREIPDHPLVKQAIDDCLREFMDVDGFLALLKRIEDGAVQVQCLDLSAPSPLSHAVLGARPYAFLDDGDAEGRRTRSVTTDRLLDPKDAADLGRLDPAAIEKVKAEAWPEIGNHDELHDALVVYGFLTAPEIEPWKAQLAQLREERRVMYHDGLWLAVERSAEFERAKEGDTLALAEILRSRLELVGPVTETALRVGLDLPAGDIRAALLALESQGSIMRGRFSGGREEEWCERRLLIRIHRYTRDRKRNEIQAVPPAQFMRFLFRWQRVAMEGRDDRQEGEAGLLAVLQQLEGFAIPAGAWERDILPLRVKNYVPSDLDKLCAAGRIAWYRPCRGERQRDRACGRAGAVDADHAGRAGGAGALAAKRRGVGIGRGLVGARAEDPGEPAAARRVVLRRPRARHGTPAQRRRAGTRRARQPRARDVGFLRGHSRADHFEEAARAAAAVPPAVPEPGGRRALEPAAARARCLLTRMRSAHPRSITSRACCCGAMASCSGSSWSARAACRRGGSSSTCTGAWRREGKFAAGGSSADSPASSSRCQRRRICSRAFHATSRWTTCRFRRPIR